MTSNADGGGLSGFRGAVNADTLKATKFHINKKDASSVSKKLDIDIPARYLLCDTYHDRILSRLNMLRRQILKGRL